MSGYDVCIIMGNRKKSRSDDEGTLVYSSGPEGSRSFGPGGKIKDEDWVPTVVDHPPEEQRLRVVFEKKGRRGKAVTLVRGLRHTSLSLERLARSLKQHCGSGGALEGATILIQGDHRERVADFLRQRGYRLS